MYFKVVKKMAQIGKSGAGGEILGVKVTNFKYHSTNVLYHQKFTLLKSISYLLSNQNPQVTVELSFNNEIPVKTITGQ